MKTEPKSPCRKTDEKHPRSPAAGGILLALLLAIALGSLGFWSDDDRMITGIRMRIEDTRPANRQAAGALALPMFLDESKYRATLRDNGVFPEGETALESRIDSLISFENGRFKVRTPLGALDVEQGAESPGPLAYAFNMNSLGRLDRALLPGQPESVTFSGFSARNMSPLEASHYETALGGECLLPSAYSAFLFNQERFRQELAVATRSARNNAARYKDIVHESARRFKISENLIYAIMRTESDYNPFAVSHAGALGLMQLMPRTAGGEVHAFLGRAGTPTGKFLFDPESNIEYGSAYLHLLFNRHFPRIKDRNSRELCVIAAYNGGPGAVLRVFDPNREKALDVINSLDSKEVYQRLTNELPFEETRRYVDKVLDNLIDE